MLFKLQFILLLIAIQIPKPLCSRMGESYEETSGGDCHCDDECQHWLENSEDVEWEEHNESYEYWEYYSVEREPSNERTGDSYQYGSEQDDCHCDEECQYWLNHETDVEWEENDVSCDEYWQEYSYEEVVTNPPTPTTRRSRTLPPPPVSVEETDEYSGSVDGRLRANCSINNPNCTHKYTTTPSPVDLCEEMRYKCLKAFDCFYSAKNCICASHGCGSAEYGNDYYSQEYSSGHYEGSYSGNSQYNHGGSHSQYEHSGQNYGSYGSHYEHPGHYEGSHSG